MFILIFRCCRGQNYEQDSRFAVDKRLVVARLRYGFTNCLHSQDGIRPADLSRVWRRLPLSRRHPHRTLKMDLRRRITIVYRLIQRRCWKTPPFGENTRCRKSDCSPCRVTRISKSAGIPPAAPPLPPPRFILRTRVSSTLRWAAVLLRRALLVIRRPHRDQDLLPEAALRAVVACTCHLPHPWIPRD